MGPRVSGHMTTSQPCDCTYYMYLPILVHPPLSRIKDEAQVQPLNCNPQRSLMTASSPAHELAIALVHMYVCMYVHVCAYRMQMHMYACTQMRCVPHRETQHEFIRVQLTITNCFTKPFTLTIAPTHPSHPHLHTVSYLHTHTHTHTNTHSPIHAQMDQVHEISQYCVDNDSNA